MKLKKIFSLAILGSMIMSNSSATYALDTHLGNIPGANITGTEDSFIITADKTVTNKQAFLDSIKLPEITNRTYSKPFSLYDKQIETVDDRYETRNYNICAMLETDASVDYYDDFIVIDQSLTQVSWMEDDPIASDSIRLVESFTLEGSEVSLGGSLGGGWSLSGSVSPTRQTITYKSSATNEWTISHVTRNKALHGRASKLTQTVVGEFTLGTQNFDFEARDYYRV